MMEQINEKDRSISPAVSAGLLFTSIAWMGLTIAMVIVALNAESLRKLSYAPKIIWPVGALMILLGAAGAWLATDELAGRNKSLLLLATVWIWAIAASVGVGGFFVHAAHHWPWPEICAGVVLGAIISIVIAFRRPRNKAGAL
jgi:hypothetical protein